MPTATIAPNVHWVGAKDPDLAVFDIVIPTSYGTTYNSYLVRGSEKTALIDCVKRPFAHELFRNIAEYLPLEKIDYVVFNHSEPDHAGALVDPLERHPKVTDTTSLPSGGRRSCSSALRSWSGRTRSSPAWSRTGSCSRAISAGPTAPAPSSTTTSWRSPGRRGRRSSSTTAPSCGPTRSTC